MNTCPITREPITPPHTISHTAANQLAAAARTLPQLMQAVDYALAGLRNGTNTNQAGYTSRAPLNLALLEEIDEMRDSINVWAAALLAHMNPRARFQNGNWQQIAAIFRIFAPKATTWAEAPQMVDECRYALERLEFLASQKRSAHSYVGKCRECESDLLAQPQAFEVTCPQCGVANDTEETSGRLLDRLRDTPLSCSKATRAAALLAQNEIKPGTVRTWIARGKLTPDENGNITPGDILAVASKTG